MAKWAPTRFGHPEKGSSLYYQAVSARVDACPLNVFFLSVWARGFRQVSHKQWRSTLGVQSVFYRKLHRDRRRNIGIMPIGPFKEAGRC